MELFKPRKDRYNPDNTYRIIIDIGKHPGVKWVSFKDSATGETTRGVFLPDWEVGGIRVWNDRVRLALNAIPVQGMINTHVLVPCTSKGVDCGLGLKGLDYRKATIGNMYVMGEVLNEDYVKMREKYGKKFWRRIARFKKG